MFCKHSGFTKIQERMGSIEKPCFSIARKGDFSKFLMCSEAVKFSEKPGIYVQIIKENVDSFFKVPFYKHLHISQKCLSSFKKKEK